MKPCPEHRRYYERRRHPRDTALTMIFFLAMLVGVIAVVVVVAR